MSEGKAARAWRSMACMRTAGGGLVHPREGCIEAAQVAAQATGDEQVVRALSGEQEMDDAWAYATWARLEREYALGAAAGRGRLLLPRHSR